MRFVSMPEDGVFRAGRYSDVRAFPPPAAPVTLGAPLVHGYPRWEDARGIFSTAKCTVTAEGAIGRSIAQFRPRVLPNGTGFLSRVLKSVKGSTDAGEPNLREGRVPPDVLDELHLVHVAPDADLAFIDLQHDETRVMLEERMRPLLPLLGVRALPADLARAEDRRITRMALTLLYGEYASGDRGRVAGVRYPGHPDSEYEAYVLWLPPSYVDLDAGYGESRSILPGDPDLAAAIERLEIALPD